jgi:hypothetical protein
MPTSAVNHRAARCSRARAGLLLGCLVLAVTAGAAQANTYANAFGTVGQNEPIGSPTSQLQNITDNQSAWTATQSTASVRLDTAGASASASSGAHAAAAAGRLSVYAGALSSVTVGGVDSQGNPYERIEGPSASAEATAGWQDLVTISAPGQAGQRGSFNAVLQLTGTVGSSASPYVHIVNTATGGFLYMDFGSSAGVTLNGSGIDWVTNTADDACAAKGLGSRLACARGIGNDPNGDKSFSSGRVQDVAVTVQFTFGTVFTLGYSMVADGTAQSSLSAYKITGGGGASGTADLSHTLLWGGIDSVITAGGNAVSGYSVSSSSGFDYTQPAAAVPEPSAGILLMAGLAGLALYGRKRQLSR